MYNVTVQSAQKLGRRRGMTFKIKLDSDSVLPRQDWMGVDLLPI